MGLTNDWCPFKKRRQHRETNREVPEKTEAETQVMHLPPRMAGHHQR